MALRCGGDHTKERGNRPDRGNLARRGEGRTRTGPPQGPLRHLPRAGPGHRPRLATGRERAARRVDPAGRRRLHPPRQLRAAARRSRTPRGGRPDPRTRVVRGPEPPRVHPDGDRRRGHAGAAGRGARPARLAARGLRGGPDRGARPDRRPGRRRLRRTPVPHPRRAVGSAATSAPESRTRRYGPSSPPARVCGSRFRGGHGRGTGGHRALRRRRPLGGLHGRRGRPRPPTAGPGDDRHDGTRPAGARRGRVGGLAPGGGGQRRRPGVVRRDGLRGPPPLPPLPMGGGVTEA
ncbi:hypothetical protein LSPH26S_02214 [Lysinibacillus sphaericus]